MVEARNLTTSNKFCSISLKKNGLFSATLRKLPSNFTNSYNTGETYTNTTSTNSKNSYPVMKSLMTLLMKDMRI